MKKRIEIDFTWDQGSSQIHHPQLWQLHQKANWKLIYIMHER